GLHTAFPSRDRHIFFARAGWPSFDCLPTAADVFLAFRARFAGLRVPHEWCPGRIGDARTLPVRTTTNRQPDRRISLRAVSRDSPCGNSILANRCPVFDGPRMLVRRVGFVVVA